MYCAAKLLAILATAPLIHAVRVPRYATVASRHDVARTEYDFVIAGGGVSGLTVADRLTEDPKG
jgi:choline dehydrogenase